MPGEPTALASALSSVGTIRPAFQRFSLPSVQTPQTDAQPGKESQLNPQSLPRLNQLH